MSDKNNLASSVLAGLELLTKVHPKDSPSALSVQTSIVVFSWAANEYYTSAPADEKPERAKLIQQFVANFKQGTVPDGCPPGYHADGGRCVPDNRTT